MTNALETYLHQIGLVPEMLLPISQRSDDAALKEDTASSGHLQHQQQQQQQLLISLTKYASPPIVSKSISSAEGTLIRSSPIIEASSVSGSFDLGPVAVAITTIANYSSSSGEPTYVHSSWSPAAPSSSRGFMMGDTMVSRRPNAVTTVTVSSSPNDPWTKSSHQNHNITQVSHVTSTLTSSPNTRQTLGHFSTDFNAFSHNVTQVTSPTSGYQTNATPLTQSVPNPLAMVRDAAIHNSLNCITKHIHTNDRPCLVDVCDADRLSLDVGGSTLSRDNSHVVSSIRQNLSDILHLNLTPFNQSQPINQPTQSTTFNRVNTLKNHCSGTMFPADDSRREEAELNEVVLSPWTLSTADSSSSSSSPHLSQSSNDTLQNQSTVIKSSLKKDVSPKGARKEVTFCTSDLVHVEEYTISPATPPHDLFLPFQRQLDNISEDTDSTLFGRESLELWPPVTQDNSQGWWFNSSTDTEPYLMDFPSPSDETKDCAPLSVANDVFGRTTIFLTSGTFRPGDSGKLNGKTVSDLSGSHDSRRTISTGTLSGIRSHRTLVKVNFIQGLLDINHNPGQTAEVESKAVQDNGSGFVSTLNYCKGIFHENLKNPNIKEFPKEEFVTTKGVDQKICHKLSHYKCKLIAIIVGAFVLLFLAIGLGVGLGL